MSDINTMRLDKWLWAARFFKTRALAQKHIELGRIKVNNERIKNSKYIVVGDVVDMNLNSLPHRLTIKGLNMQRRPAPEARLLYEEDAETIAKREHMKLLNQAADMQTYYPEGRPTKRDRRQIDKFKQDW
ncbi:MULTISPECIES: RNA-binding S4 domain-containing protein [Vitreoscilla]|uniref:RNA-binding protein n=1 Tax=Vitreoscilla stercoraria TaxID=61 RepID=A0ABY4E8M4_VITST|nr:MULTISPECIES: S4 domain-containing protein [Vitreoscilla]AUZ04530.1 S4 RNA-binding domain-containing protein [Vitreoscilla sp. C1]UOO91760.1 RNA-binding protein [Vitreoscilla stercoraria]